MDSHTKGRIGEEAVNELASHTYLKYWCFPNPKNKLGDNKEICDLLILFKTTCIIVAIKNYTFKGNYSRYFNSTLNKAIKQIHGAERKLYLSSKMIFDHPIRGEFEFIPKSYPNIQRIIVNLSTVPLFYEAGLLTKKNEFAHILNWNAFLRLVQELNTIPDFIQYLIAREDLLREKTTLLLNGAESDWDYATGQQFMKYTSELKAQQKQTILLSGNELDLLANYFINGRKFSDVFYSNEYTDMHIELDGNWESYLERKEVIRKKEEENLSYFFDEFIEREVLHYEDEMRIEIAAELTSLSRFERRIAGKQLHDFFQKHKGKTGYYFARRYGVYNDLAIGYFIHGDVIPKEQAMLFMRLAGIGYSYYEGYKSKKIIIIGINTSLTQTKFAYFKDIVPLQGKAEEDLIADLKSLNWFQNIEKININEVEYPDD